MHEWSLAESVIATVISTVGKEKVKDVIEVKVVLGELQQVETDIFEFAINELKKESGLEKVKFIIETEKAILKCRVCGYEWSYDDVLKKLDEEEQESIHFIPELAHSFMKCPKCGSPDFEVVKGRGVMLEYIKLKKA